MGRLGTASPTRLLGPRWLQTLHLYTLHVGAAALLLLMFSASKQRHHQKPILPTFLSAMVHRRVAAAYTDWLIAANGIASHHAASRSGIRLLLLLILAGAANGRFPLLLRPRRALEEHPDCAGPSPGGWPIAFQTLRIDLEGAHPRRATPPKVLGASPRVRRLRTVAAPAGFCCCSCCRCGPTTPLRQAPCRCKTISSLSL